MSKTGFAKDQLASFIARVERLEAEKKAIADDVKEVYAEAKSMGFDCKTMRKVVALRKLDKADFEEQEAMLDLYMGAVGFDTTPLAKSADHESLDPKLVERIAQAVQTSAGQAAVLAAVDTMIERVDDETGEITAIPAGSHGADHGLPDKKAEEASSVPARDVAAKGPVEITGERVPASKPGAVASAPELPAFLDRRAKPRPHQSA